MQNDGEDFLDWLHRIRKESEEERQRLGQSYADRLARAEKVAQSVLEEMAEPPPVARDRPRRPRRS
jgi:hypothetical protein